MKKRVLIFFCLACHFTSPGQYYLRGQVYTGTSQRLPSVRIFSTVTRQQYKSDYYGNFSFPSVINKDSLVFSCDGFDTLGTVVTAEEYARVKLMPLPYSVIFTRSHVSMLFQKDEMEKVEQSVKEETYLHTDEYCFQPTDKSPGIAFSANINRASYGNVRRMINEMEYLLPPHAVRIEELLNYFNFNYTEPPRDSMFYSSTTVTSCPWNKQHQLMFVNVSAKRVNMENVPPNNIVILLDASGSMDMPNKLPLLKSGLIKMVCNLRPVDTISMITFGDDVPVLFEGLSGNDRDKIIKLIRGISADGPTPGEAGIKQAFAVARRRFIPGGNNRIILAADGDFNVGISSEKDLMLLIEQQKQKGIYLTCLGVGSGNYKDSRLAVLAQKGNGNFSYIDNEQEAERVLVTDLTRTLFTVADKVYISVSFNSSRVKSYRLLGYENDNAVLKDSTAKLRGGEIGSGHSLMAVFEIEPAENSKDSLLASMQIHYTYPLRPKRYITYRNCTGAVTELKNADPEIRKAAAVVMFGIKLKDGELAEAFSWHSLQKLAAACFDREQYSEKEFLQLIVKAKKMYTHRKKYGGD